MKRIAVLFLGLLLSLSNVHSANVGIGVGLVNFTEGGYKIYVPVNINPVFRLEPYFEYFERDSDTVGTFTNSSNTDEYTGFGVGIYGQNVTSSNTSIYYGINLGAYTYDETSFGLGASETESDGTVIAPTLGFEYKFVENVSLGGEVAVRFSEQERDAVYSGGSTSSNETDSKETVTAVILRYMF